MAFLHALYDHLQTSEPEWHVELSEDGTALLIRQPVEEGDLAGLRFLLRHEDGSLLFEDLWRLPLPEGQEDQVRDLVLGTVRDGFENRGWEVPILLLGGPLQGKSLTKTWEDLVGRLVFAYKAKGGRPAQAHLYKWHLKRDAAGTYLCRYERTLEGEAMDEFLRRGVDSTGPFVLVMID